MWWIFQFDWNFHNIPDISPDFVQQLYQGLWVLATRNGKNQSEVLKAGSSSSWVHTIALHLVDANWWYCWWKKSCTSCCGESSIIYRVLYISGGAGFLPSTVWKLIKRTKTKQVLLGSYISDASLFHFKHNHDNPHQMWSKNNDFPRPFPSHMLATGRFVPQYFTQAKGESLFKRC